ncbi:MAG: Trm112 family protein [Candidatus Wallbacteria bacterium]
MSKELIDILCCPVCRGDVLYLKETCELICKNCKRAYPVRDDIPIMLEEEAEIKENINIQ